ncbi:MAG TPA: PAS domain-containing protein, partial [Syntrophomonadaceae bacterium]|nr:PAS domain-containing protein [Syntrophomonadaceae bacterium]
METKRSGLQNSAVHDNPFSIDKFDIMTKERWEGIIECKKRFLEDKSYDPRTSHYMNPDVAASWVRCRKMGIDPHKPFLGRRLKNEEFAQVLEKNRLLIEITRPLVNAFKHLAVSTGYGLYLADNKGVFLLHEGEVLSLPLVSYPLSGWKWDEKNIGTTAHSLSLMHKRPFHLTGVENYSVGIENIIASSAPILDENGEVLATLVLAQNLIDEPWKNTFQTLCSNTLGLITAISAAVESQLKLKRNFINLKIANETVEATLALIEDGIVTIDKNGTIIYSNEEARRIFKLMPDEVGEKNINEFLAEESPLLSLAE